MPSVNIRISEEARNALKAISGQDGCSMHEAADRAIELYRRQRMLEEGNRGYAALRADPEAWAEELAERGIWDRALTDGLEDD